MLEDIGTVSVSFTKSFEKYTLTWNRWKKLDEESNVINLKMQVNKKDNEIVYTYKIINGISNIKGGIKVLVDLNYPKNIIDNSMKILDTPLNTFI